MSKAKADPAKLVQVGDVAGSTPDQHDPLTRAMDQLLEKLAKIDDPHKACNKHINDLTKERNRLTKQVVQLETGYREDIREIHDRFTILSGRHAQLTISQAHATKDAQIASVMIVIGSALLSVGGALSNLIWKSSLLSAGGVTAVWGLYLQNHLSRRSNQRREAAP